MIRNFLIVVAVILPAFTGSHGKCPKEYLNFDAKHTFCLPVNRSCSISATGVKDFQISEILKLHNEYRSRIAMGQEALGGGLPTASNMMQLTWDKELQDIAQKWAEQCNFDHDCRTCRKTQKFKVGQNLYITYYGCPGECALNPPDWKGAIKYWYDEVALFEKKFQRSFQKRSDNQMIGHFTQLIWAETQKIGCGYAAYKDQGNLNQFYVCNYGPAGNMRDTPVYKEGTPCSNCPKNSCCGSTCKGKSTYPGLCHRL